jgi:hypothetical protein
VAIFANFFTRACRRACQKANSLDESSIWAQNRLQLLKFALIFVEGSMHQKPFMQHGLAAAVLALTGVLLAQPALAQNFPISGSQRATANQVAQAGVPISELSPNAPDRYTVKRGDTLWGISGLFLKSPWRWPELWGMNMSAISNPHRIYPGQELFLERINGRAVLRVGQGGDGGTIKVSPRVRSESLNDTAIPTLDPRVIEPFLAQPMFDSEDALANAPRIVATQDGRVLLSQGDRAYARGPAGQPITVDPKRVNDVRLFRQARALRDPVTQEILGYEAELIGNATIARPEIPATGEGAAAQPLTPATIDITRSLSEIRSGDKIAPVPPREFVSYTPRAPLTKVEGRIVSVYGSSALVATQNQVVAINAGKKDGLESGHVLSLLKDGLVVNDPTTAVRTRWGRTTAESMKLPDERSGLMLVFRTFDRVSYALVLTAVDELKVGDRFTNPR